MDALGFQLVQVGQMVRGHRFSLARRFLRLRVDARRGRSGKGNLSAYRLGQLIATIDYLAFR